ncbi:MAG TPA: lipase maturation factor family protein [Candidatus Angelobacter sp.]|nr:lipase maturation factor family protein [Candidatus Angelobacter sp.]
MPERLQQIEEWLLGPESRPFQSGQEPRDPGAPAPAETARTHLLPRWFVLRALGLIYFSAFYSLLFQAKGLIGTQGILPAGDYLGGLAPYLPGIQRFWEVPTVFWFGSGDHALMVVCWLGIVASVAVVLNLWPRLSLAVSFVCLLSFVSALQVFSSYQSDGMLLEAGFIALFFAPPGVRPGLGERHPPSRLSLFLLRWEWFRIYFESGVVKLASHDYSWRHLTAMDDYYQNGPLPTWIGWYVQQWPHWFHATTALMTLVAELGLVWMLFLPRRLRIICFFILTPFQIGIILTANYTFLNYLVLVLGVLLLDDGFARSILPARWRQWGKKPSQPADDAQPRLGLAARYLRPISRALSAIALGWVFYATTALLLATIPHAPELPLGPARALDQFRVANSYGLFANMTHERYEIEFQGSNDGQKWKAYPFRYKPQELSKAPGIYAPYQPRFEWNLWFASLENWRGNEWVVNVEARLLENDPDVLELFAGNPFSGAPPQKMRAVISQYWFTDRATKRQTGAWWRRELLGLYAPPLERTADGKVMMSR